MKNELNFAKYIDIFDILHLEEYYKTDIHWKQENLVNVANTILSNMNNDMNIKNINYKEENILNFKGTYAYRLPIKVDDDKLSILTSNTINSASVYNYLTNTYNPIYDLTSQNLLDKYDIFLYGPQPLLTIYNHKNQNNKNLIIFRDSFSSSLAPLLLEAYNEITLIDTRYISPTIIGNFVDFSSQNSDVLFIYSTAIINNSYSLK